jgi:crotonobetainyl-CoA:carnitine CoA-transferase CaiB-like acyl-CoA transferase
LSPQTGVVEDPVVTALLAGMRVLDLSQWRPMPHATQILADLGAEVLKVEPPGGDPMRGYPEIFASVARGKRSIELDLRREAGSARALALAAEADVVCEAWRPGVADRLGVGYDAVRRLRPDTVYCSLSGYGAEGPLRDVPGHDVNFQALAGALAPRDGVVAVPRLPVADLEGGTVCALLVCAAWSHHLATGEGERIDVAMTDVVAWWVGTTSGVVHDAAEERTAGSPGYGVFRTRDDRWLALGVLAEARLWDAIAGALDLDDLLGLDFPARLAMTAAVNERIGAVIAGLDLDDALARLEAGGAPVSPVLTPEAATGHPQLRARGIHVQTAAGTVVGLPARLAGARTALAADLPAVGAHPEGFTSR